MANKRGNQDWKKRFRHGRNGLFNTPESLIEGYMKYRQFNDSNPFPSVEKGQGSESRVPVNLMAKRVVYKDNLISIPKMRVCTMNGFLTHYGLSESWLRVRLNYIKNGDRPDKEDFITVIEFIRADVDNEQYVAAAAGMIKENIVSRQLGLKEGISSENINHNFNINSRPLDKNEIKEIGDALEDNF